MMYCLLGVHSKGSSSTDKTKQQLTFSQSEFPHSPVAMDTDDITSGCVILPPTPPTKKVSFKCTEDVIDRLAVPCQILKSNDYT